MKKKERSVAPDRPDIEIAADVKARELRFDEVPETEVHPPAQTERENLPEKVLPEHTGITFRNISVRMRIANELTVTELDERGGRRKDKNLKGRAQLDSGGPRQVTGKRKSPRKERK